MGLLNLLKNFADSKNILRDLVFGWGKQSEMRRKGGATLVFALGRLLIKEISEGLKDLEDWLKQGKIKDAKRGCRRKNKRNRR